MWIVKFGAEVRTETFSARFLNAVGDVTEPSYFVPSGIIVDVHDLKRAKPFASKDGRFRCARFKLRDDNELAYADEFQWCCMPDLSPAAPARLAPRVLPGPFGTESSKWNVSPKPRSPSQSRITN